MLIEITDQAQAIGRLVITMGHGPSRLKNGCGNTAAASPRRRCLDSRS